LAQHSGHLPKTHFDFLKERQNKLGSFKIDEAFNFLESLLQSFDRFFICVDAIDECTNRYKRSFLELLSKLSVDFRNSARIFITGRLHMRYMVEKALPVVPHSIVLEANENDIKKYVLSQLEMDQHYDDMDEDFKKEIMDKIVETADGM
jgi:hypothetical protein